MTTLILPIAVSPLRQRLINSMDRWLSQDRRPAAPNAPTLDLASIAPLSSPKLDQIFLSPAVF